MKLAHVYRSPYRLALNLSVKVQKGKTYRFAKFVAFSRAGWGANSGTPQCSALRVSLMSPPASRSMMKSYFSPRIETFFNVIDFHSGGRMGA
jgi:hypothetical protein